MFVCDLFLILGKTYIASYAGDSTPYTANQNTYKLFDEITGGTIYLTFKLV